MDKYLKIAGESPELMTVLGIIIAGLLTVMGKWWIGFFAFKAKTTDTPSNAAEAAVRMQSALLADVRIELGRSEDRFNRALNSQKTAFDARIDRMRKIEDSQQDEIKNLTRRLTEYESKDKEYKREIAEWKKRYWELDRVHAEAKAKLSVYEKDQVLVVDSEL